MAFWTRVVSFKTLFQTGIGQMAIADENTQATRIQKRDVDIAVGPAGARRRRVNPLLVVRDRRN
jgi:hypothetical protein